MINPNAITAFLALQESILDALPSDQRTFLSDNYYGFALFLRTDAGKEALKTFILDWQTAPNQKSP